MMPPFFWETLESESWWTTAHAIYFVPMSLWIQLHVKHPTSVAIFVPWVYMTCDHNNMCCQLLELFDMLTWQMSNLTCSNIFLFFVPAQDTLPSCNVFFSWWSTFSSLHQCVIGFEGSHCPYKGPNASVSATSRRCSIFPHGCKIVLHRALELQLRALESMQEYEANLTLVIRSTLLQIYLETGRFPAWHGSCYPEIFWCRVRRTWPTQSQCATSSAMQSPLEKKRACGDRIVLWHLH